MCILLVFYLIVLDVCVCAVSVVSKDRVKLTNSRRVQHFFGRYSVIIRATQNWGAYTYIHVRVRMFVNLSVRISTFRDWFGRIVMWPRDWRVSYPHSYCCADHCQLSQAVSFINLLAFVLRNGDILQSLNAPHAPKSLCILLMTKFHIFVLFWDYFICSMS